MQKNSAKLGQRSQSYDEDPEMRVEPEMTIHPPLYECFLDYAASVENRQHDPSVKKEEKRAQGVA
jgi:hypothetical protein